MKKVPMTNTGAKHLERELHELKTIKRPQVIDAIAEARAHGDLKENAEYHAAKESQSFIEGRIAEIENKLVAAQIIDVSKIPNHGKVIFGATIQLINTKTNETFAYQIVGEDEADIKQSKISVASPIARALIGKEEGDTVDVKTPAGLLNLEIDKVEYI
ncbi:MAG: transcription elongation factor GreA [Rickettsiella sp.]|nr:transcription elongation factor GreA [Rickettsiella sp.]